MTQTWTTEQILTLAPDPASAKAGQGLTNPGKWVSLGANEQALWGECQGSGKTPYQVQIELAEPAFRCSCPSHKFPCKHGIGLFLIYANNRAAVTATAPPDWVSEWLGKREEKTKKREAAKIEIEKSPEELAKAEKDQAKRAAQREQKVQQGLQDLRLWMHDLIRQGLAAVQARPYKFWNDIAGRMVDAQAPGVARMLREMGSIPASGVGWQERLLERLGLLTLLLEAYDNLDTLPAEVQTDVREAIGWNVKQESVLAEVGVADLWLILGQRSYDEEQFRVQRTWLRGHKTGRDALILHFTRAGQAPENLLAAGTCFEATLTFFPSASPLRALLKERTSATLPLPDYPAYPDYPAMLSAYADAVARNPWLDTFPASCRSVVPVRQGETGVVQDGEGYLLPLRREFDQFWKLLGISGGHPITLFGEWDGASLLPISVWTSNRLASLA
ncbi:MAG: zinc finger-containing protein [Chthonomonadales bacterium]|nr:zinc finger-containing protein [Chthonomonadales bacterium]